MAERPSSSQDHSNERRGNGLSWLILALALLCLMPSNESLWIDEGFTVPYAQEQGLGEFLHKITHDRLSEPLMPLGMLSSWAGAKVLGRSELGLRLVSAFWAGVAILLVWRIGLKVGLPWLPVFMACHPFLWYYAGEARAYAMVIAMSAGVMYAFVTILESRGASTTALPSFLLFGVLLCATHALAIGPFAAIVAVTGVVLYRGNWRPGLRDAKWIAGATAILCILGTFYAWTLARGIETTWDGPWKVGLRGILFSTYEILGFAGLGPGRYELRGLALSSGVTGATEGLVHPSTAGLILLGVLYVAALVSLLKPATRGNTALIRIGRLAAAVAVGSAVLVHGFSFVIGYPFWGRHIAAVFPWVVLVTAVAATSRQSTSRRSRGWLIVAIAALLLASSLLIRFHPRHARDDYRAAARVAHTAVDSGSSVWWSAAGNCARFYEVPFCSGGTSAGEPCVVFTTNMTIEKLESLARPSLVILSKPEIHDATGALREYLSSNGFTAQESFMAFKVFASASEDVPAAVSGESHAIY